MTCGVPGICDKVTGHCNGCQAGWEGEMCENGKYICVYALCISLNIHFVYYLYTITSAIGMCCV